MDKKRVSHEINRSGWDSENRFVGKTRWRTRNEFTLSPGEEPTCPTYVLNSSVHDRAPRYPFHGSPICVNKRLHPAQPSLTPSMLYVVSMHTRSETSFRPECLSVPSLVIPTPEPRARGRCAFVWRKPLRTTGPYWEGVLLSIDGQPVRVVFNHVINIHTLSTLNKKDRNTMKPSRIRGSGN